MGIGGWRWELGGGLLACRKAGGWGEEGLAKSSERTRKLRKEAEKCQLVRKKGKTKLSLTCPVYAQNNEPTNADVTSRPVVIIKPSFDTSKDITRVF